MTHLRFSLSVHLDSSELPEIVRPVGPLFHRWLPDGENDAVYLTPVDAQNELAVWFERRAKLKHGFLEWARDGQEFDVEVMKRQGKLDAGVLRGRLQLATIAPKELEAIKRNPIERGQPYGHEEAPEDEDYVALAKRVIGIVQPLVSRFIATLRYQYGQYWLQELHPWDSRLMALGAYCDHLGLLWWDDERSAWCRFLPTELRHTFTVRRLPGREYEEYLTESDWQRLQQSRCLTDLSTEVYLLGQATRALDLGEFDQASVNVITALELTISSRLYSASSPASIQRALQSFISNQSLQAQIVVLLRMLAIDDHKIEDPIDAVNIRNRIVHEAYRATQEDTDGLRRVMQIIRELLRIEELKIPALDAGNSLGPPGKPRPTIG